MSTPHAYYGTPPALPTAPKGLAVGALVVGIVAFFLGWLPFVGLILGAAAITLGIVALRRVRSGLAGGRAMSIAGIVLGACAALTGLFFTIAVVIGVVSSLSETADTSSRPAPSASTSEPAPAPEPSAEPSEPPPAPEPAPSPEPAPAPPPAPAPAPAGVLYEVFGDGGTALVTYTTEGFNQQQENGVPLPWSTTVPAQSGAFAINSLVAQNGGGGNSTCRITRGGKVISENTSNGQFVVVTCSG